MSYDATSETLVVGDGLSGVRLTDFLERTWPNADRGFLRRLVRDGQATVNGADAHPGTRLRVGDVVLVALPDGAAKPPSHVRETTGDGFTSADLPILAESSFALVVDKPAGLPCVPDRSGRQPGVHGLLDALRPGGDLRIAHRLDRFTSGCLVLAKGLDGARWLDEQLRARTMQKEYLALVDGVMPDETRTVTRWIGPDPRRPGKAMVVPKDQRGARDALTEIEVVERFRSHTLVRARPRTGRGHQIRVHLASLHHPVVADADYGASGALLLSSIKGRYKARRGVEERPLLARMFLHAARVTVPSPDGTAPLVAESPLPADLEVVLRKLRHFGD